MVIRGSRILIVPETSRDEAYIEDTLGLKKSGDYVSCRRISPMGLSGIAYLEIKKPEKLKPGTPDARD